MNNICNISLWGGDWHLSVFRQRISTFREESLGQLKYWWEAEAAPFCRSSSAYLGRNCFSLSMLVSGGKCQRDETTLQLH